MTNDKKELEGNKKSSKDVTLTENTSSKIKRNHNHKHHHNCKHHRHNCKHHHHHNRRHRVKTTNQISTTPCNIVDKNTLTNITYEIVNDQEPLSFISDENQDVTVS